MSFSLYTVVVEPTVEIDCAFLLGAITMVGISVANELLNENEKKNKNNILLLNFFIFV